MCCLLQKHASPPAQNKWAVSNVFTSNCSSICGESYGLSRQLRPVHLRDNRVGYWGTWWERCRMPWMTTIQGKKEKREARKDLNLWECKKMFKLEMIEEAITAQSIETIFMIVRHSLVPAEPLKSECCSLLLKCHCWLNILDWWLDKASNLMTMWMYYMTITQTKKYSG